MCKVIEHYTLIQMIGEGVYAKVYRAISYKNNQEYAIKVIAVQTFKDIPKLQQCTANEINILTSVEPSEHIIKFIQMLKTQNNFYFVYQYCNGGTLQKILRTDIRLSQAKALNYLDQLLEAFKILQKYNIMHRDLKPDNIFFHNNILKLGDFGFCKNMENRDSMTSTMLGSPIYMSPEILKGFEYTAKADIWSLGVVFFQMLFGHCPFQSNSIAKLICVLDEQQLRIPIQINPISIKTQQILKKMLIKEESKRISWQQLFLECSDHSSGTMQNEFSIQSKSSSLFNKKFSKNTSYTEEPTKKIQLNNDINFQINNMNPLSQENKIALKLFETQIVNMSNIFSHHQNISKSKQNSESRKVSPISENYLSIKRKLILEQHNFCRQSIKTAIEFIQLDEKDALQYSFILIKRVSERLKKIKLDISVNNLRFDDILFTIKKESQEVQFMLWEIQQELIDRKIEILCLNDSKKFLCIKYQEQRTVLNLKLWYQMINFLFGNNHKQILYPRDFDIELLLGIKPHQ